MLIDLSWISNTVSTLAGAVVGAGFAFWFQSKQSKKEKSALAAALSWEIRGIHRTLCGILIQLEDFVVEIDNERVQYTVHKLTLSSESTRIFDTNVANISRLDPKVQEQILKFYEDAGDLNIFADNLARVLKYMTSGTVLCPTEDEVRLAATSWNLYFDHIEELIAEGDTFLDEFGRHLEKDDGREMIAEAARRRFGQNRMDVEQTIKNIKKLQENRKREAD